MPDACTQVDDGEGSVPLLLLRLCHVGAGEEVVQLECNSSNCSQEPPGGLVVALPEGPGRLARYIRFYSGSSAADGWVRFLEVATQWQWFSPLSALPTHCGLVMSQAAPPDSLLS